MANVSPRWLRRRGAGLRRPADEQEAYIYLQIDSSIITEVEDATVNTDADQHGRLPQRHSGNRSGLAGRGKYFTHA